MELIKNEVTTIAETTTQEAQIRDLNDLQLALVGGGMGEVIVA